MDLGFFFAILKEEFTSLITVMSLKLSAVRKKMVQKQFSLRIYLLN